MNHPQVVEKYKNKYPVVFISLKEVFWECFEEVFSNFQTTISNVCRENEFLLNCNKTNKYDKLFLDRLMKREGKSVYILEFLSLVSRMLRAHYDKPAFVIIDEYDVPMAKTLDKPYYDKVRDMIEHMLELRMQNQQQRKSCHTFKLPV